MSDIAASFNANESMGSLEAPSAHVMNEPSNPEVVATMTDSLSPVVEPTSGDAGLVDLTTLTPEQVEQQLIKEQQPTFDPMDASAHVFQSYLPKYKQVVAQLSNKQARRVLNALIEVPLNEKPYKHNSQLEKAAFLLGDRLLQARWTMQLGVLQQDAIKQAAEEVKAAEASNNVVAQEASVPPIDNLPVANAVPQGAVPLEEFLTSKNQDSIIKV
jgi:hypothetical protein